MIKVITLSTGTWMLVTVSKGAKEIDLPEQDFGSVLQYKDERSWNSELLPAGHTYTLIGLAKDLTEDQWKQIVEKSAWKNGEQQYRDYRFDDQRYSYDTPSISGLSLLWIHRAEPATTVILKQND